MSSRDYSVNDFGYVFNAEMIDKIIEKVKPKTIQPGDTYEMAEIMGLQYIGEFTGEAIRLDELGDDDFRDDAWSYSADSIFYFPIGAYSLIFRITTVQSMRIIQPSFIVKWSTPISVHSKNFAVCLPMISETSVKLWSVMYISVMSAILS